MPLGEYVQGKIYRGVLTGLNEAFVIDAATRERLIVEDGRSAEVIKPFLAGRDVKRYGVPKVDKYLILLPKGWTKGQFGDLAEVEAFVELEKQYPAVAGFLTPFAEKGRSRYDKGDYWWELRACDYYGEFEKEKILWPGISAEITAFAFDDQGLYGNDNNQLIVTDKLFLLGILNSRLIKFYLSKTCDFVRGGFARLKMIYVVSIPIPATVPESVQKELSRLVTEIVQIKNRTDSGDTEVFEREIDRVVYGLYGLGEGEIGVVEGRFVSSVSS